jgi:hypothetical protein
MNRDQAKDAPKVRSRWSRWRTDVLEPVVVGLGTEVMLVDIPEAGDSSVSEKRREGAAAEQWFFPSVYEALAVLPSSGDDILGLHETCSEDR